MTNLKHTKEKKTLINIKYCIAAFFVASYVTYVVVPGRYQIPT